MHRFRRFIKRLSRPITIPILILSGILIFSPHSVASTDQKTSAFDSNSIYRKGEELINENNERLVGKMIVNDDESGGRRGGEEMSVEDDKNNQDFMRLPFCEEKLSSDEIVLKTRDESIKISESQNVVVATLDGKVTMLDELGNVQWSVPTGQLFSSTISSLQLSERGKFIKLIPSLTGGLYKYDGESIEAMPLNADLLLKKSFKLAQDVVITGGKEMRTFGVSIESGEVKYECGMDGCQRSGDEFTSPHSQNNKSGLILVIKKELQTVRAIDSSSGVERWNFSVGTHELALSGIQEGCYEPASSSSSSSSSFFKILIPEGVIYGADSKNKAIWTHKFESPISQAWVLHNGQLEVVDPIKSSPLPDAPSLYVGLHKSQLYVQESHETIKKLSGALEIEGGQNYDSFQNNDKISPPLALTWRPSSENYADAPPNAKKDEEISEFDDQQKDKNDDENNEKALAPLYQNTFFVYERDEIRPLNYSEIENDDDDDEDEDVEEVNLENDGIIEFGMAALLFWWKEIMGITLLTAVIINIIIMRPITHYIRRRTIAEVAYNFNMFRRWQSENGGNVPALPPIPSSTSNESLETTRSSNNNLRSRTYSSSSNHSGNLNLEENFSSQYLKEFEPIQCLGRGAFGTVFEAKKKIDEQTYAVKRIPLPKREKSRSRVMREVKALAKLDHKNIVRYFNAWTEEPPVGWLEKNDPLWHVIVSTPTQTYEHYPTDVLSSGDNSLLLSTNNNGKNNRKEFSQILVPDSPLSEDSSFIVFENEVEGSCEKFENYRNIDEKYGKNRNFTTNLDEIESEDTSGINFIAHEQDNEISQRRSSSSDFSSNNEWSSNSSKNENEKTKLLPHSKFFKRPTTLDIPSSSDDSSEKEAKIGLMNEISVKNDKKEEEKGEESVIYLYIQQELCQKRTLQDWLREEKKRDEAKVVGIFSQIVGAVEYIHSHKLIHRDLKPGNIFLASSGPSSSQVTVKIGDFGLATTLDLTGGDEKLDYNGREKEEKSSKLTGHVGTVLYMAPEQFDRNSHYDSKVDIFSLGLIFYELLTPFTTDMEKHTELNRLRKSLFHPHFISSFPQHHKLIKSMVSHEASQRPDASQIKTYLLNNFKEESEALISTFRSKSYPQVEMSGDSKFENGKRSHHHKRKSEMLKTRSVM